MAKHVEKTFGPYPGMTAETREKLRPLVRVLAQELERQRATETALRRCQNGRRIVIRRSKRASGGGSS